MVRDGVRLEQVTADTLPEFRAAFAQVFANPDDGDAGLERARGTAELDRMLVARHDGQVVGTAGNYSFAMSMPWADPAPCAGVTAVSVRADHRRRGLLRQMMDALLDDAVERG
jgi:GNAT superfamily N-acetyltransferase